MLEPRKREREREREREWLRTKAEKSSFKSRFSTGRQGFILDLLGKKPLRKQLMT
jgi:hypothetical protein